MGQSLTPRQRIGAFLAGKPIDHVPCVPLILNHAARTLGVPIRQYGTDGQTMGRAHVAAYRRYGHDLVSIFTDTSIVAEALGTELFFPEDDVSRVAHPVVAQPEDLEKVRPIDVRAAGRLPLHLEAVRHCVKEIGDEVFVACCYPAPFSTAAGLRGTDMLARDLFKRPDLARAILEKCTEATCDFAEAVVEAGGIPVLVDPVATGSLLSPKAFAEFALPGLVESLAKIKSLGMPPILHICGRTSNIIEMMAQSGAAVLSIDQIELSEARAKVGHKVCLMGNVRPTQTLLQGTPDDVRREARMCLDDCRGNPGGFILATGCEVPIETPPENVDALMEVARTYG